MRIKYIICSILLLSLTLCGFAISNYIDENKISSPNHTEIQSYKIKGSVTKLFLSTKLMKNFCNRILRDLVNDLFESKIIMPLKLKEYYISISIINMINGNDTKAIEYIEKIREIDKNPENQIMSGLTSQVLIESEYGQKDLCPILYNRLKSYPLSDINKWILSEKRELNLRTRESILRVIKTQFDPVVRKYEFVSLGVVHQIIRIYHYYYFILPYKKNFLNAYSEIIREKIFQKVIYGKM